LDGLSILVSAGVFATAMLLILALGGIFLRNDSRLDTRLAPLQTLLQTGNVSKLRTLQKAASPTATARSSFRTLAEDREGKDRLQTQLMHAGVYAPWAYTAVVSAIIGFSVSPILSGLIAAGVIWGSPAQGLFFGVPLSALGALLPWCWLSWLKRRRHVILTRSLPDFLDLMVACLESGVSIDAALLRVIDELELAHPLLAGELRVVKAQMELGATPDAAVRTFADRADYDALRSLSTVLQQARRFGVGLADALRQHADELRIQREQTAEEKAQKASVQVLLPTMLLIFPAIFVVLAGPAVIQLSEVFAKPGKSTGSVRVSGK
jgi:tight adherence protein C